MAVSFDAIPANIRTPLVAIEFSGRNAEQGLKRKPYKALLIGTRNDADPDATQAVLEPVQISTTSQAAGYFGKGSVLESMAEAWFANNRSTEVWAVAVQDSGFGQSAGGVFNIAGPATESGEMAFYVNNRRYTAAVTAGDTATEVVGALRAALIADPSSIVSGTAGGTANAATFSVTVKGSQGAIGNTIKTGINLAPDETAPAGIVVTETGLLNFAAGVGDPDLSTIWSTIAGKQFDVLVSPWETSAALDSIEGELLDRWGPLEQIDGLGIVPLEGDFATAQAVTDARNSKHVSYVAGLTSRSSGFDWASAVGGIVAAQGEADPARPFQRIPIRGVHAPAVEDMPPQATRNVGLSKGLSTFIVDEFGTPYVERQITASQTDESGSLSTAYMDVNTVLTLSFLRWSMRNRILSKYPRHKLADDGTRFEAGQAIATPKLLKGELIALFSEWEAVGLVEGFDQFKRDLIVERNVSDPNRVDIIAPPDLVNQLRVVGAQIAFLL